MRKSFVNIIIFALCMFFVSSCERKSGRKRENIALSQTNTQQHAPQTNKAGKTLVKMKNQHGVYYVPCRINGHEMEFIFDTGASDITISLTEALFLFTQGKLTEDDFIGIQQYQIADGSIREGTIVVLRTVEIGSRQLKNVRASIVHNMVAPLLLGQSALAKFGKISIDYNNNEITFE
jgi:aspartyl protease family protein